MVVVPMETTNRVLGRPVIEDEQIVFRVDVGHVVRVETENGARFIVRGEEHDLAATQAALAASRRYALERGDELAALVAELDGRRNGERCSSCGAPRPSGDLRIFPPWLCPRHRLGLQPLATRHG